jgi:hypothetical protein
MNNLKQLVSNTEKLRMLMRRTENKSVKNISADKCFLSRYCLRENNDMKRIR